MTAFPNCTSGDASGVRYITLPDITHPGTSITVSNSGNIRFEGNLQFYDEYTTAATTSTWTVSNDNCTTSSDYCSMDFINPVAQSFSPVDHWYVAVDHWYGVDYEWSPVEISHPQKMQHEIDRIWNRFLEEERQAEKILAESKAQDLMKLIIGEKEFIKYKETGKAYVKGKNGLYLVKKGGGISQIKEGKIIDFCVHIDHRYNCPPTDHAIALKLMLEEDDNKVIKLANRIGTKSIQQLPIAACM